MGMRPKPLRPLTDSERAFVEQYLPAADRIAARFARTYRDRGIDWREECYLALCRLAQRHGLAREARPGTLVGLGLKSRCLDLLRDGNPKGYRPRAGTRGDPRQAPRVRSAESTEPTTGRPFSELFLADELPVGWEQESYEEVWRLTRRLQAAEGAALRFLVLHAATCRQNQIAPAIGRSKAHVSLLVRQGLARLREVAG